MTRAWAIFLDAVDDTGGLWWLLLWLFLGSIVFGLLHYFYPRWVPHSFPRLKLRRAPKPENEAATPVEPTLEPEPDPADGLPDLPAHAFMSRADRLAAEGRFAEAVRERLRAIVRGLVERRVLEHQPGMTVTELAQAAGVTVPTIDAPLRNATGIFSDIWYGQRPATVEHDNRMRQLAAEVSA